MFTCRQFMQSSAAVIASKAAVAAPEYDLLIRGGRISLLRKGIPVSSPVEVMDAEGTLVVPGLIDIHLHVRDGALPPAEILRTGVTTMVDAGSRGSDNIDQLVGIAQSAPNRIASCSTSAASETTPAAGASSSMVSNRPASQARGAAGLISVLFAQLGTVSGHSRRIASKRVQTDCSFQRRMTKRGSRGPSLQDLGQTAVHHGSSLSELLHAGETTRLHIVGVGKPPGFIRVALCQ